MVNDIGLKSIRLIAGTCAGWSINTDFKTWWLEMAGLIILDIASAHYVLDFGYQHFISCQESFV